MLQADEVDYLDQSAEDPVALAEDFLGFHPWTKQAAMMRSVWKHDRTAVRSCNGAGKTTGAAATALTFLAAYAPSLVITTAPTGRQVENLLWREIRRLHRTARYPYGGRALTTRLEIADDHFAIGYSAKDTAPETFAGHHAENILFIVDEASGVSEPIYEAIEGSLAGGQARLLLIGNPTQVSGTFYQAFHKNRDQFNTLHISAFDTPNFTGEHVDQRARDSLVKPEWVERMKTMWGEHSPLYAVRVEGEFPAMGDDTVVTLAQVEAAQERARDADWQPAQTPVVLSVDVARFGSDFTVFALRRGDTVEIIDVYNGRDTVETANRVMRHATDHAVQHVVADDAGLGSGVTDTIRHRPHTWTYEAFNGADAASDPLDYPNRRSEAWFLFADQIDTISLPDDELLAAELVTPKYTLDSKARRKVEAKDETKKRLGRSPDRADAVLMAYAARVAVGRRTSVAMGRLASAYEARTGRGTSIAATATLTRR